MAKEFAWSSEKNDALKRERGISFERVVVEIAQGNLLDILAHPNTGKYGHQMLLVVRIDEYVYAVPCVDSETELFLKTIIPSRKLTRHYEAP